MEQELIKKLKKLKPVVSTLAVEDIEKHSIVVDELLEVFNKLPDQFKTAKALLKLCAQVVANFSHTQYKGVLELISSACVTIVKSLKKQNESEYIPDFNAISSEIFLKIGESGENWIDDYINKDISMSSQESVYTINDLAALIIQLDMENPSYFDDIVKISQELLLQSTLPESVKAIVREIDEKAKDIDDLSEDEKEDNIADIGRLVGRALRLSVELEDADQDKIEEVEQVEKDVSTKDNGFDDSANDNLSDPFAQLLSEDADLSILKEYIVESREFLEDAEASLLQLETDPSDEEAINVVFRAFHSIKGTSGFLGLEPITSFSHSAENLLSRVRDGEIICKGYYADLSLKSVDMLKELISLVEEAINDEPVSKPPGYDALLTHLARAENASAEEIQHMLGQEVESEPAVSKNESASVTSLSDDTNMPGVIETKPEQGKASSKVAADSTLRVSTNRLDQLIDIVGELVIAHSMVAQDGTLLNNSNYEFLKKVTHSGKIVRELQDLSMSLRMIPLQATFQKMNRLVRDTAQKKNKMVKLITDGEETEVDRNMVDLIKDPLVHILRNAVDHGIEMPDVREANGKSATGTVKLSAFHSGGNVVVQIQDDGKGLDKDKIIKKAIDKGILSPDSNISDEEAFNLIFLPAFSTADKITDVSGRGVGLDVVRKNIEALRGRIELTSEAGQGSTFTIKVPLTLAITDGMLIKIGEERYIVPTVNIHRSLKPEKSILSTINGKSEMVMIEGEFIPIFRIHSLFDIQNAIQNPLDGLLVVVDDGGRRCALLVDELLGKQQVVTKSLGAGMGKVKGIAGGAILGDGRVGLILDTVEIAALARQTVSELKDENWKRVAQHNDKGITV